MYKISKPEGFISNFIFEVLKLLEGIKRAEIRLEETLMC